MSHFSKQLIKFGVFILVINIVGIWIMIFLDHRQIVALRELENSPGKILSDDSISKDDETLSENGLDHRISDIESVQGDLVYRVEDLESSVSALAAINKKNTTRTTTSKSTQRESIIYLGEGSAVNLDWQDVKATTITVNTANYPNITAVYFEAGLAIGNGNMEARLIDKETLAIFGQLEGNTPNPTWKSTKVNLTPGSRTYMVQIRSSSGERIELSGARLRILSD